MRYMLYLNAASYIEIKKIDTRGKYTYVYDRGGE